MIINFYTAQFYPILDFFSYICSILEIDVLNLVLFSVIIIDITYIIHNSSSIVNGVKSGLKAVLLGAGAAAGSWQSRAGLG